MILRLISKMEDYGVTPEIECFDTGMLNYTNYLMGKSILKSPYYINVILGNLYNAQSDLSTFSSIYNNKPKDSLMCIGGIGKEQLKSNIMGLLYFDGIRIGLEDNLYFREKEITKNINLLKRIHLISEELNYQIMNHKEFGENGFKNKKNESIN